MGNLLSPHDQQFYFRVLKSLHCRRYEKEMDLPPEVRKHGLRVDSPVDVARWSEYHRQSWGTWRSYIAKHLPGLRAKNMTFIPKVSDKVAVVVETREHGDLEFVVRKTMHELRIGAWALVIICGLGNCPYVRNMVQDWSFVHIRALGVENLTWNGYNKLVSSRWFLDVIESIGGRAFLN